MRDWPDYIRERLAAEGESPALHQPAIDELAAHLDDVRRSALGRGLTDTEADREAERELAGLGPLAAALGLRRSRVFETGRTRGSLGLGIDVRHALRQVRTRPAMFVLAMLTLALGIGACTVVFSMYKAVLLKSLPYPDASELVLLWEGEVTDAQDTSIVAAPVYQDWRARAKSVSSLGIWELVSFNISATTDPAQVLGIRASSSVFDTLGVRPAMGRVFTPEEDAGGHHVVVISDRVWRDHFAARADAIGQTVRLNSEPYEVIGVMPAPFVFPRPDTAVWVPIAFTALDLERDAHSFYVVGRLKPDAAFGAAQAEFTAIGAALAREYPENKDETSRVTRLSDFGTAGTRKILRALAGAVALVLLIGCVNVANLQIARALERRREFIVRFALGARVGRVARQLFVEGAVLAAAAGAAGVLVALLGTRTLDALLGPQFLTFWFRGKVPVTVDIAALAFTAGVSIACALVFSFAPLIGLRRAPLAASLNGTRGLTSSAFGMRRVLVAVEIALAIIVLCGAGLLIKSFTTLLRVSPGLDPERVITMQVSLPQEDTYGPPVRKMFCESVSEAAAGGPFVALGAISHLPLSGANAGRGLSIDGYSPPPDTSVSANYRIICPGYFKALGIPMVWGRDVSASDAAPVVVINRTMAERYWKNTNPVGQRIRIGQAATNPWMTVVGVSEDTKHFGLESDVRREIFVPYRQNVWPMMTLVAKTASDITPAAQKALGDALKRAYPDLPGSPVRTMSQVINASISWRASFLRLLLVFAALGLLLSAVGIYSVLAYFVSQRARELGVRVALGASRPAIVRMVLWQSLLPTMAGVIAGVGASLWTGRLLTDMLFHTTPDDAVVTTAIATLVMAVGFVASWIPAHRAAGVDPTITLRE